MSNSYNMNQSGLYLCDQCGCLTDRQTCINCAPEVEVEQDDWTKALAAMAKEVK